MKLFINKSKFLNTLKKELPTNFDNDELDKLSLLNSKSIHIQGKKELRFFSFQEIFKIKSEKSFSFNATKDQFLIKTLDKKLSKHFSYLGTKKNYKFNVNQIYNKGDNLVLEFMFYRK